MNYYIADLHIDDKGVFVYEHRPFKDINEMKKNIIQNWNKTVKPDDTVYLLGDIGNPSILLSLTGNIVIVLGNHDDEEEIKKVISRSENPINIKIYDKPIMIGPIWLSHEPIGYMPPEIPYLNIHGHLHRFDYGLLGRTWHEGNRYFNVSAEKVNYKPISEIEIKKIIQY